MNVLLGNSIVRGVDSSRWNTICFPGMDWNDLLLYIMDNLDFLRGKFIYLHIGPVHFSRLHCTENRKEAALLTRGLPDIPSIVQPFRDRLQRYRIRVIFCPIYPMEFETYNNSIANGRRQILQDFYSEWTLRSQSIAESVNRQIIQFNHEAGLCTPFLHHSIFTRRRGRYSFHPSKLADGLHPTSAIREEWRRELRRVMALNRAKHR